MMNVSAINVYPVKSLRGSAVPEARVCAYGLEHDRQWMLVDVQDRKITQRECPPLALLAPHVNSGSLHISVPNRPDIMVPLDATGWTNDEVVVDVWGHVYVGVAAVPAVNQAFSEATGIDCRLLSIRTDVFRLKHEVAFHDDAAMLLAGEASLAELNRRLETPVPMNRFRPSVVITGATPFEEDTWQRIAIGDTLFREVKPCERCSITTVDQSTGVMRGPEPLKTLATFRRKGDGVAFGQYYRPEQPGAVIRVGDAITVLETMASQVAPQ
jgi:uncharacterized protein YcbX